jgi:hypothetical protein
MNENRLLYALSTIAQYAAALVGLIIFGPRMPGLLGFCVNQLCGISISDQYFHEAFT